MFGRPKSPLFWIHPGCWERILAFITKTAPKKIVASMMGIYFAVTGLANFVAAKVGAQAAKLGELAVFVLISAVTIALGLLLVALSKKINRLTHEDQSI